MPPRQRNNARHRKGLPFLFFLSHLLFCAQEGDCSCQDGLSCVLTKKVIEHGIETPVKQCMPGDVDIEVESIDLDNQAADAPMRIKRWLFFNVSLKLGLNENIWSSANSSRNFLFFMNQRCLTEEDCSYNRCCAFNKRCVPKLKKFFTCVLTVSDNINRIFIPYVLKPVKFYLLGWGVENVWEDHMVFKGKGRGINRHQQKTN